MLEAQLETAVLLSYRSLFLDFDASLHEAQGERPLKLAISPEIFRFTSLLVLFPENCYCYPQNTSLVHFSFSELLSVRVTVSLSLVWLSLYHNGLPLL